MQILKSGRITSSLPEASEPQPIHASRIQCRRCLLVFDWLDKLPPGMKANKRANVCEIKTCSQPFYLRSKIVEGRSFLIPFILGSPCLRFSEVLPRAERSSSSGKRPESKRS